MPIKTWTVARTSKGQGGMKEKERKYEISITITTPGNVWNKTKELELYLLQEGYCVFGIANA